MSAELWVMSSECFELILLWLLAMAIAKETIA